MFSYSPSAPSQPSALPGQRRRLAIGLRVLARWSLVSVFLFCLAARAQTQAPEFRAFWVYGWNSDLLQPANITKVVADLRAGNFNAVIPQVRRRGDALYNSRYEPKFAEMDPSFDGLADLINKAHDTRLGPRIEVHPWMVTYHVWSTSSGPWPTKPNHVLNLHPDWLLKDVNGNTNIGGYYTLDPGHPGVQQYTYAVAMDIITNYDVDGLNFDYIRYESRDEGYNQVTIDRFNRRYKRTGKPSTTDILWLQFRREQITGLLRKIYLNAIAVKPNIKISCDTITWTPAPTSDATWYSSSAAWTSVLQDWRGWMQEGIMDLNIPMAYFRQGVLAHAQAYTNWSNFAKDRKFGRHLAVGPGIYLNGIDQSIAQMRQTRERTAAGNQADGVSSYAFHYTNTNGVPRSTFLNALVSTTAYDKVSPPIFQTPVPTPDMPWKSAPSKGHLKGVVYDGSMAVLDGAAITLTGPITRAQTNDATGFYGFVDLPPGEYKVTARFGSMGVATRDVVVTTGKVSTMDLIVPDPRLDSIEAQASGEIALRASGGPGQYSIDFTTNLSTWYPLTNVTTTNSTFESRDSGAKSDPQRFYRARRLQ